MSSCTGTTGVRIGSTTVFVPLLSVIRDAKARAELRHVLREYQRQLVADRGLEVEAGLVEVLRDLQHALDGADLPLRDITSRFIERHAEDLERKITPKWVGGLIRRRLGLRTVRSGRHALRPCLRGPAARAAIREVRARR